MILLRAAIFVLLVFYGSCLPMNLGDAPLYTPGLFQGDIVGFDQSGDRAAIVDYDLLWPGGVVPYVIHESASSIRQNILDGMEEYHQKTCIRFVEAAPGTKDYVLIGWWQGCNSQVGRVGGLQHMSLGTGCHWKGLVVHELGHAVGFYHEQARSDRDDYLEVLWDNILYDFRDQFIKMKHYEHNLLEEDFDYKSIMLYEETAFSKNGEPTVRVKQDGQVIGPVWKKPGFSESDVRRVNKLYQCFGAVRPNITEVPDYSCDFSENDCGFESQDDLGSEYERIHITLGGRTGYAMVADSRKGSSSYARLITPYFKLYGRPDGCFSFDYYLGGPGTYSLDVMKQGGGTFDVMEVHDVTDTWQTAHIPVQKNGRDQRLFITATFDGTGADGKIAVGNFKFAVAKCPK